MLARARMAPGDAVMIGDTPYDAQAGQRATVLGVGLASGGFTRAELEASGSPRSMPILPRSSKPMRYILLLRSHEPEPFRIERFKYSDLEPHREKCVKSIGIYRAASVQDWTFWFVSVQCKHASAFFASLSVRPRAGCTSALQDGQLRLG